MNTAEDSRILMAERCAEEMKNIFRNTKHMPKEAVNIITEAEKKILEIKYSYAELDDLTEYFEELKSIMKELLDALGGTEWSRTMRSKGVDAEKIAKVKFGMNIIYNLDSRLRLPSDPAYAVDIRLGRVESVRRHPNADRLKICNVNVGKMITVITNDLTVKEGDMIPVAMLPPADIRGVVSEGMFVGAGEGVSRKNGKIGELPSLTDEELNSVRKEVLKYLR